MDRAAVGWTRAVLSAGTLIAAGFLVAGLLMRLLGGQGAGLAELGADVAELGVVVLLATPGAGLVATFFELRGPQPRVAWLALAVLAVLVGAVLIALR